MTRFLGHEIIEVPNKGGFSYDDLISGTSWFRRHRAADFSVRLIFTLLLRLQLLPVLIWLCVGRVYPQWAAAHPFVFYGVLSLFGLLALSCWLRPLVEWLQETQKARLAERLILDELHRAAVEGRTISGFQVKNGVPIAEYEK